MYCLDLTVIKFYVSNNVAVLKFANSESKVNCYTRAFAFEVNRCIEFLDRHHDELHGAILISDKKDNFFAGADLKDFNAHTRDTFYSLSKNAQNNIRFIAGWDRPVVGAVMGACMGAGLEMILGCQYVIAADTEKTLFAAPEGTSLSQLIISLVNRYFCLISIDWTDTRSRCDATSPISNQLQ